VVDPVYDYNPVTDEVEAPLSGKNNITIMAVDNLPCELPRDASRDFGRDLIDRVLPSLLVNDRDHIIELSIVAKNGSLTKGFSYLEDYVG
jgi:saccharopine dehydrogenase (NAD+, L-lysine-forming)